MLMPWLKSARGPAVASGGATTLDSFAGLVAWYKGPISGATNGAAIPSWPDSKGTYNFTGQSGTTYNSSAVNSLPSVSFNGSGYADTTGPDSSTYPYTLVAVVKLTDTSNYRTILGSTNYGAIHWRINQTSGKQNVDAQAQAGIATDSATVSTGTWHVLMLVVTSSTYAFWTDGVAGNSGSHSQALTAGRTFRIGNPTGGGQGWLGEIAEVGIYGADRSSDATAIYNSLKSKYGL